MMSQPESSSTPIYSFDITSQAQQQTTMMNPQALHPMNNNNSRRSSPFVQRLIVAILLLFVTISTANFIAWRVINPLPPDFQVNEISHLNSTLNKDGYSIVFFITNPNKNLSFLIDRLGLIFEWQVKTKVSTRESMALTANLSAYVQKNSRKDFPVHGRMVKLNSFLQKEKEVNLKLQVSFRVRFLAWNWLPKSEFMEVGCRNLNMRSLFARGEGNLIGERGQCSVQKHV